MIKDSSRLFTNLKMGKQKYYDLDSKSYKVIPGTESNIHLDNYRTVILQYIKILSVSIHDIGDGVLCFEFTSKSNAIGEGIGQGS
jgi:3-hydroxyacyl-CoA dehydrogenase